MLNKNQISRLTVNIMLAFLLVVTPLKVYRKEIILTDFFIAFKKDTSGRALPLKIQDMKTIALGQNLLNAILGNQLYENPG